MSIGVSEASLADIAAVTNGKNDGMFGNDWAWIVILLLFGCGTGIWALVDFIRILCNKLKPASGEFGNPPQNTAAPAFQPSYAAPKQEAAAPQFAPAAPKFTEAQPEPAAEVNKIDRIERELNKLNDMRERGLISVDEYYTLRKDILGL